MTLKQQKLIGHFLEVLEKHMEHQDKQGIDPVFLEFFGRTELIDIVLWLYTNYDRSSLSEKSDNELLQLIGCEANLLKFTMHQWNESISATPKMSQSEVHEFFDAIQIDPHYLRDKPVDEWDAYDKSNYYSILLKHGKTKRVFAIFTSDVDEKDKYVVTTKPSYFFDTREEAESELKNILKQKTFKKDELKIMSLWHINS